MSETVSAEHGSAREPTHNPGPDRAGRGDRAREKFVVELEPDDQDTILLRRVRNSYAGSLPGLWGPDTKTYLEANARPGAKP